MMVAVLVVAAPVHAQGADLEIPLRTSIDAGSEPAVHELAKVSSGPLAGRTCEVRAVRPGGGAVDAGIDLMVQSGGADVVLFDVQRAADATTDADDPIELDRIVTITVTMEPGTRYDGDVTVELDCGLGEAPAPAPTSGLLLWFGLGAGLVGVLALGVVSLRRVRVPRSAVG